ncbi:hypothetical protein TTRE_0000056901 [Trichuris trichiura]|uniref:Uncharacterized protein n=1 Tax=Trichuris trichiura TaxID=36087 RepID=A0A077Z128_TRITR|nr:hypothetical protein TTRE_0000056901 [Trichuris trichiura]
MDIAQIEPSVLGLILAFTIAALFAVIFYWATKESSDKLDGIKSSSPEVRRSPVQRLRNSHFQRSKKLRKTSKKKPNGDVRKTFNVKGQEPDSSEKSLDAEVEKKAIVNDVNTKEETEDVESLEERETAEAATDSAQNIVAADDANDDIEKKGATVPSEIMHAADSLIEVLPNKVTEELLRDWMTNMTDSSSSWKTIKRRCVLVESLCLRVKQLEKMLETEKRVMADRDRRLTERWDEVRRLFKSKIDMCSAFLANEKELFRLRELVESLSLKVNRANNANQTLRKENSECTARLRQALIKQSQDSQDKINLESRCLQLEKDLQMRYEDKMHWVNELHLCEAKLTMAESRRRELELLVERVRQKLQNDAVEKDGLHQKLCDLHVLLPSSRVDKDGSEWKLIKKGVQKLVDSLSLREAEITSLKQRLKSANEIAYSKLTALSSAVTVQKDANWKEQNELPIAIPPSSLYGLSDEGRNRYNEIDFRVENGTNCARVDDSDNDVHNLNSANTSNSARDAPAPSAVESKEPMSNSNANDVTANIESISTEDVGVQTCTDFAFEAEKYEKLLERIANLHEMYHNLLTFQANTSDKNADELALVHLNDMEICMDIMSNKIAMLTDEVEHLKKRNEDLRSKNYRTMDLLRETESRFVDWANHCEETYENDKQENKRRVTNIIKAVFGNRCNGEEDLTKLLNYVKKEYDNELEKQLLVNSRYLNCLLEREVLLDNLVGSYLYKFSSMSVAAVYSVLFGFLLLPACAYNYAEGYIAERLNRSSERILEQLLLRFTDGPFPWKVGQYNTKQFFPRYNRYYWIGKRYYQFDPDSLLADRLPCEYALPVNVTVSYEDDEPVKEIVFQCRKFQQACCGEMDCCLVDETGRIYSRFTNE